MRSLLICLTLGTSLLVLSGCPEIPAEPGPEHVREASIPAHRPEARQRVDEIAWFQGTLDEAFSHHGCPERHPHRTLFRL